MQTPVASTLVAPPDALARPVETTVESLAVRLERVLPVLLVALVGMVALLTVTPWPVGAFQDDAIYTILAKALATGEGYRMINLPGAPHATHYPPGYPFFLSLLWRVSPSFPDNIVLFKFANAAWLSLAALGAYVFARRRLAWTPLTATSAAATGTLAIVVLLVTGVVLSEPMFMALLFPALILSERAADTGSVRTALLAGVACGILALVRTLGAVAVPAAILVLLTRRHWKAAVAMGAAAALCLVPWQLWLNAWQHEIPPVLLGKYGAYGPWISQGVAEGGFAFLRDVAVANARSVERFLSYVFMPVTPSWARVAASVAVLLLLAAGLSRLVRRSPVTALFVGAYTAVVLAWPFEPERFILAIWPLVMVCLFAGIQVALSWYSNRPAIRMARSLALASALAVAAGFVTFNVRGYRNQWWASVQRDVGQRARPIAEWVAAATSPSDVLMTDDDLLVYLYTGRQGMPTSTFTPWERLRKPTDDDNIAAVRVMIDTYQPRYYITTSQPGQRAAEALTQGERPLLRRYRLLSNAFIYERITP